MTVILRSTKEGRDTIELEYSKVTIEIDETEWPVVVSPNIETNIAEEIRRLNDADWSNDAVGSVWQRWSGACGNDDPEWLLLYLFYAALRTGQIALKLSMERDGPNEFAPPDWEHTLVFDAEPEAEANKIYLHTDGNGPVHGFLAASVSGGPFRKKEEST